MPARAAGTRDRCGCSVSRGGPSTNPARRNWSMRPTSRSCRASPSAATTPALSSRPRRPAVRPRSAVQCRFAPSPGQRNNRPLDGTSTTSPLPAEQGLELIYDEGRDHSDPMGEAGRLTGQQRESAVAKIVSASVSGEPDLRAIELLILEGRLG